MSTWLFDTCLSEKINFQLKIDLLDPNWTCSKRRQRTGPNPRPSYSVGCVSETPACQHSRRQKGRRCQLWHSSNARTSDADWDTGLVHWSSEDSPTLPIFENQDWSIWMSCTCLQHGCRPHNKLEFETTQAVSSKNQRNVWRNELKSINWTLRFLTSATFKILM